MNMESVNYRLLFDSYKSLQRGKEGLCSAILKVQTVSVIIIGNG